MASTPKRARQSDAFSAAGAALFGCAAADVALKCNFASLPLPVVLSIFALLPADARARAAAVCLAWRHALTVGPSAWKLWMELDLSETSGVTCARGDAALEGAAALARGRLRTLKLCDFEAPPQPRTFTDAALLRVVTANAGLEELTYASANSLYAKVGELQALVAAAPALRRLVTCAWADTAATARALLRREPPYGALRLLGLGIKDESAASPLRNSNGVVALAADVAACESLRGLVLYCAALQAPAAVAALVDAVLTRLVHVYLDTCTFAPDVALPQLARLVTDDRTQLEHLSVEASPTLFANARQADVAALRDALARSRQLMELSLKGVGLRAKETMLMAMLLQGALASRPPGSPEATVTVE